MFRIRFNKSDLMIKSLRHSNVIVIHLRFFFSSRRRHTRFDCDWSSDVCSSDLLEDLGARVIECPTIQIVPPKTWKPVDDAIRRLGTYQWLLFTSANAIEQFMDRMGDRRPSNSIAVVGGATAAKLSEWGLKPAIVPKEFRAEGLLAAFPENLVGTRILFPRAEVARELLPDELRRRGATVDIVTVYRTVKAFSGSIGEILESEPVHCIVFTSPSTIPDDLHSLPSRTALALIGPVTREAAQLLGLKPDIVPAEATIPSLVTAIREHLKK